MIFVEVLSKMRLYKTSIFIIFLTLITICTFYYEVDAKKLYIKIYEEKKNEIIVTTEHAKIHIEKNYLSEKEIYEISQKIENGIVKVKDYLGKKYLNFNLTESKIKYFIKDGSFISDATSSSGRIRLSNVKKNRSPYLHETVHVLANKYYKYTYRWLSEGLAVYLDDYFGGDTPYSNSEKNSNELARQIINNNEYKEVVNYFPDAYFSSKKERSAFYILSASFVKFIENEYGKDKLLKIYNSADSEDITDTKLKQLKVEDIVNKTLEQLKQEWLNYIEEK